MTRPGDVPAKGSCRGTVIHPSSARSPQHAVRSMHNTAYQHVCRSVASGNDL